MCSIGCDRSYRYLLYDPTVRKHHRTMTADNRSITPLGGKVIALFSGTRGDNGLTFVNTGLGELVEEKNLKLQKLDDEILELQREI